MIDRKLLGPSIRTSRSLSEGATSRRDYLPVPIIASNLCQVQAERCSSAERPDLLGGFDCG